MYEWVMPHTCEWVMSHIQMSHIRTNHATYANMNARTVELPLSRMIACAHWWMSHVPYMNDSCPMWRRQAPYTNMNEWTVELPAFARWIVSTHEWVMSHVCMSHVSHIWIWMNGQWNCRHLLRWYGHTCQWVMSHVWTSHGPHTNMNVWTLELPASCVMECPHVWMSHVPCMNESVHHIWTMSLWSVWWVCVPYMNHRLYEPWVCGLRSIWTMSLWSVWWDESVCHVW